MMTETEKAGKPNPFVEFQCALHKGEIGNIANITDHNELCAVLRMIQEKISDIEDNPQQNDYCSKLRGLAKEVCGKINGSSTVKHPIQDLVIHDDVSCSSSVLFFAKRLIKSPYTYSTLSLLSLTAFLISHYGFKEDNPLRDGLFKAEGVNKSINGEVILVSLVIVMAIMALVALYFNKKYNPLENIKYKPMSEKDADHVYEPSKITSSNSQYF